MASMLNLTDILQLIVNRLNESPFAEEQLIPPPHQPILHVLADFGQEFEPLGKEHIVQRLGNIPTVPKELPKQLLGEGWHRLAVVDIAWSQAKGQEFPLIIDDQVEFEAIEPAHRRLAPGGPAGEHLVRGDAAVVTDQRVGSNR